MTADERQHLHRDNIQRPGKMPDGRRMDCGIPPAIREAGHPRRDPLRGYYNRKRDGASASETCLFHPHKNLLRPGLYYMHTRSEHNGKPLALAVAEKRLEKCKGKDGGQRGPLAAVCGAHGTACRGVDG